MKNVIQLVDSVDYIENNCFQHQLAIALGDSCALHQVTLDELSSRDKLSQTSLFRKTDGIISCLKQRTLLKNVDRIKHHIADASIVVYDQDPWQSYMDDSPFKGAYDRIASTLNVRTFALTTEWWVFFLKQRGLPSTFVKMGVLPQYCSENESYEQRAHVAGFVGSVHPRRQKLLDVISEAKISTSVLRTNSLSYESFLREIAKLRCFVHNEDMTYTVDGQELNFNTGMWVKDIEAASQGCFSIRNVGEGSDSYFAELPTYDGFGLIRLCEHINQVPEMIRDIEKIDPSVRQWLINETVKTIRGSNVWKETAEALIMNSCHD